MQWTWSRFGDLSLDDLYDALALRCRVFIVVSSYVSSTRRSF